MGSAVSDVRNDVPTDLGALELCEQLGCGSFAQVRKARCKEGGAIFAVKIMHLDPTPEQPERKLDARYEAKLWWEVGRHDNVVALHNVFYKDDSSYFVMEHCERSLREYLQSCEELSERTLAKALADGGRALAHVHGRGVVHRDVKPDNFVARGSTVKLIDFGLADVVSGWGLFGVCGSAPFMAPEMLSLQHYNGSVDVWSLGAIAYVFLFGEFPYSSKSDGKEEIRRAIKDGDVLPSFRPTESLMCQGVTISEPAVAFAQTLLQRDAVSRVSAAHALLLPFLRGSVQVHNQSLQPVLASAIEARAFVGNGTHGKSSRWSDSRKLTTPRDSQIASELCQDLAMVTQGISNCSTPSVVASSISEAAAHWSDYRLAVPQTPKLHWSDYSVPQTPKLHASDSNQAVVASQPVQDGTLTSL